MLGLNNTEKTENDIYKKEIRVLQVGDGEKKSSRSILLEKGYLRKKEKGPTFTREKEDTTDILRLLNNITVT